MADAQRAKVAFTQAELGPLRATMRDIQLAVASYYELTSRTGDIEELGTPVRAFLTNVQQLNESLAGRIEDSASYQALMKLNGYDELIDAVRYARNVVQHVLHVVRPDDATSLIGGTHGLRTYARWAAIPSAVDAQLHKRTRSHQPSYVACIEGREVADVMLDVLHAFWRVAPDIVYRDKFDEWMGFPLRSQPGVISRLHPEEPEDVSDANNWLNTRRPNGTLRLICGQRTIEGEPLLYGFTFTGRYTFSPFVEVAEQVKNDIANGSRYVFGDAEHQLQDRTGEFSHDRQGAVFFSTADFSEWTEGVDTILRADDWSVFADEDTWARVIRNERGVPGAIAYGIRRARRLNAFVASRD